MSMDLRGLAALCKWGSFAVVGFMTLISVTICVFCIYGLIRELFNRFIVYRYVPQEWGGKEMTVIYVAGIILSAIFIYLGIILCLVIFRWAV